MKNLIIFGIGTAFAQVSNDMWQYIIGKYNIKAVVDSNSGLKGRKVFIQGKKYEVTVSSNVFWGDYQGCYIYITTNQYFDEIKKYLLKEGVEEEYVLEEAYLVNEYLLSKFSAVQIGGKGIEIGGPSFIFRTVYNNCISCDDIDFAVETVWNTSNLTDVFILDDGECLGKRYRADATDIHIIKPEEYDFVLSSNNIEHIANPLKAISEFIRILKTGGILVLVVPNKIYNFDHRRDDTLFEHIKADYENGIKEDDLGHLDEILEKHDLSMDIEMTFDEFKLRSLDNFHNRCLHHHVFSIELLKDIAQYFELEIKGLGEVFNNYYMIVVK